MHRLFLDSADGADWHRWLPTGAFHGVTTNPTILKRADERCTIETIARLAERAFGYGLREFQAQGWGAGADDLVATGRAIAAIDARMTVKLPITAEGVQAAHVLKDEGARITITAVYAPHQVLTACAIGADYVAPYHGRISDLGRDGDAIVGAMQAIAKPSETRVLVASLRGPDDVSRLAALGCDTFTMSAAVAEALFTDPDTLKAVEVFEADARG